MGCIPSSDVVPEEVAAGLFKYLQQHKMEAFDELAHEALWHQRQPDWALMKQIFSVNIETTSRDWKESLLHYAVRFNETTFMDMMMQYEPGLGAVNSHGNNVIHTCCVTGASIETFELLVKDIPIVAAFGDSINQNQNPVRDEPAGSPSDFILNAINEDGDSALHIASRNHFGWLVDGLLKRGASRNIKNREGDTPWDLIRNANQRNPLSRGATGVVRKKSFRSWWDKPKMELHFIAALLQHGPGEEANQALMRHQPSGQFLEAGQGDDFTKSGSFEVTAGSSQGSHTRSPGQTVMRPTGSTRTGSSSETGAMLQLQPMDATKLLTRQQGLSPNPADATQTPSTSNRSVTTSPEAQHDATGMRTSQISPLPPPVAMHTSTNSQRALLQASTSADLSGAPSKQSKPFHSVGSFAQFKRETSGASR